MKIHQHFQRPKLWEVYHSPLPHSPPPPTGRQPVAPDLILNLSQGCDLDVIIIALCTVKIHQLQRDEVSHSDRAWQDDGSGGAQTDHTDLARESTLPVWLKLLRRRRAAARVMAVQKPVGSKLLKGWAVWIRLFVSLRGLTCGATHEGQKSL